MNPLKIALPNKGRLREPAIELLKTAGFRFHARGKSLVASCMNENIVFVFLRVDDIPVLIERDAVQMGITGEDLVLERNVKIEKILALDFGKCQLCLAGPNELDYPGLDYFKTKTIATSFPLITQRYFNDHAVKVQCVEMRGSVEGTISLGLASGIVDIVETGDSLRENKLKILEKIGAFQTSLFCGKEHVGHPLVKQVRRRLEGIVIAQKWTMLEYNISKTKLKEAEAITPGYNSPTVASTENPEMVAVQVMVSKDKTPKIMDALEKIGATAIFETQIKNCRL